MEITPKLIHKNYNNKEIDKSSAIEQLVSLIENSENLNSRLNLWKKTAMFSCSMPDL